METRTGFTTLGQSGPGSNGNEIVLNILESSRIGASPLNCVVTYLGETRWLGLAPLLRCSWCILRPQAIICNKQKETNVSVDGLCRFRRSQS